MNNIKEKISAMYDGELNSSEIDELIELENKTQDINLKKLIKMYI